MGYQTGEYQKKQISLVPSSEKSYFLAANSTYPNIFIQKVIDLCPGKEKNSFLYCTESPEGKKMRSCPSDAGSPLYIYNYAEKRLIVLGLNTMIGNRFDIKKFKIEEDSSGLIDCGSRSINMFIPIHNELDWIISIVNKICLQPEMMKKYNRFCKCDNKVYTQFEDEKTIRDYDLRARIVNGTLVDRGDIIKARIVNGTPVDREDFKYVAALFYSILLKTGTRYEFMCTGTVVNRKFKTLKFFKIKIKIYFKQ